MQNLTLTKDQKQTLVDISEKEKPNESCAILFGKSKGQESTVVELFLTENIEESPVNFTISNDQLLEAYRRADEKKLEVVGIFHSHPNSEAFPSETDKKFMESNPVVWIIYSGTDNSFKAFILESEVKEIQLNIT